MKIVINSEFGGFGLSDKAVEYWAKLSNRVLYKHHDGSFYGSIFTTIPECDYKELEDIIADESAHPKTKLAAKIARDAAFFWPRDIPRDDLKLVEVVEVLGSEANGFSAVLKVVEIPDNVDWQVMEYDGIEWVAEKHRTWS